MIDILEHTDKLEELFKTKYKELKNRPDSIQAHNEFWVSYCDKHDVLLMHSEWVSDFFNNERKNKICISNPEEGHDACFWILVPNDFAEKALVLNGLPD